MENYEKKEELLKYFKIFIIYFLLSIIYFIKPALNHILFAAGDALAEFFPLMYFYKYEFLKNGLSLWIPYFFLGMPYIGILQSAVFYPLNFIYFLLPLPYAFNIIQLLHFSLASFFLYLYLKKIGLKDYPSFIGGFLFGFSGFLMAHQFYISMINTVIWIPLITLFYEKLRKNLKFRWSIMIGGIMGIQILGGHIQLFLYSSLFILFYILFLFILLPSNKKVKFLLYGISPFFFSVIFSLPQLISTYKLAVYSVREKIPYEYFATWSFPPYFLLHSFFPFIFGGGYSGKYWGPWWFAEMGMFVGSLPIVLAFYTAFKKFRKNSYILFFFITTLISLFLAFGGYTPFYKILYYFPIYNLFRGSARHLIEFHFSVAVLFSFGVNFLIYDEEFRKENLLKFLKVFLAVFILLLFFILMIRNFIHDYKMLKLYKIFKISLFTEEGKNFLAALFDFKNKVILIPSLFVILYSIFLISFYFGNNSKIYRLWLFIIIFFECFSFGYFRNSPLWKAKIENVPEDFTKNQYFLHYLKKDPEIFRAVILEEEFSLFNIFTRVSFLNGFDPLVIKDFEKLLEIPQAGKAKENLAINNILISSLNVKYIIYKKDKKIENITYVDSISKRVIFQIPPNKRIILQAKKNKVGMMSKKIRIKPNTYYLISAEARGKANGHFTIDLYRWKPFYDYPEQQISIPPFRIRKDSFKLFFRVINTGKNPPEEVYLRIFTRSTNPIEIKDVKFIEIGKYAPFPLGYQKNKEGEKVYRKIKEWKDYVLYENTNYLPRVFFVESIRPVRNIDEIKRAFYFYEFNPYKVALLYKKDYEELKGKNFKRGKAKIKKYETDKVVIETENDEEGFLVFSDQYYPGWRAFIDGKETKIYKVNGLIRGIVLPEGRHKVVFRYMPIKVYASTIISFLFLILCIGYLLTESKAKNKFKLPYNM